MSVKLLNTLRDAAEELRCSKRTVQRLIQRGELLDVGEGRTVRIPGTELEALVARRIAAAQARPVDEQSSPAA